MVSADMFKYPTQRYALHQPETEIKYKGSLVGDGCERKCYKLITVQVSGTHTYC